MSVKNTFLSTLSLRRATTFATPVRSQYSHFYPRSPCGERPWQRGSRVTYVEISIHALLAESDTGLGVGLYLVTEISIHALLAESDVLVWCSCGGACDFYPRSPCGERPKNTSIAGRIISISIHALLAESDLLLMAHPVGRKNFYPRSPCGERQQLRQKDIQIAEFLSTLSLRRATFCRCSFWQA